jgi:hypothetical protein
MWTRNAEMMLKKKEKTKGRSEGVSEGSGKDSDACRPHNMLLFLRMKLAEYKEESSEQPEGLLHGACSWSVMTENKLETPSQIFWRCTVNNKTLTNIHTHNFVHLT